MEYKVLEYYSETTDAWTTAAESRPFFGAVTYGEVTVTCCSLVRVSLFYLDGLTQTWRRQC